MCGGLARDERRLTARAVGGVLLLREAGRDRRNDRAKACRSGIWCDAARRSRVDLRVTSKPPGAVGGGYVMRGRRVRRSFHSYVAARSGALVITRRMTERNKRFGEWNLATAR